MSTARPEIGATRVLHVVHGSPILDPDAGGTERYVHALASASLSPVFTRNRADSKPLSCTKVSGYALWSLGLPIAPDAVFEDTYNSEETARAISTVLEKEEVEVVHFHHFAHLGFNTIFPVLEKNIPYVVTLHDYHLPCARGQLVDRHLQRCPGPSPSRCASCLGEHLKGTRGLARLGRGLPGQAITHLGRKLLSTLPTTSRQEVRAERRIASARVVLEHASLTISPSKNLADRMNALRWVNPQRLEVVDLPLVSPISVAPPLPAGPVRFLFVGSLIPTKGIGVLMDAFERTTGASLVVYGPTPVFDGHPSFGKTILERLEKCERAHYGGVFDSDSRNRVYGEADVLVLPSTWEENSPLVVREATAAGLRIIASDVGGIHELAPDARRIPPGDSEALRSALQEEMRSGHTRNPAKQWPMEPHLNALDALYRGCLSASGQSSLNSR